MSKFKHTPGPWKVKINAHPTTDGSSWGWVGQDKIRQLDEIPGVNVTWEEGRASEANAKLIAAAPDMLKALEFVREYFLKNDRTPYQHLAYELINSVIKKATGGK